MVEDIQEIKLDKIIIFTDLNFLVLWFANT